MRIPRVVLGLALLGPLLAGLLVHAPRARAAEACFAETGRCVRGRFLDYWLAHGGLAINGFPLSEERQELLEDGNTYTVQYFERTRMEHHLENPPPFDVLLGQFGRRALRAGDEFVGAFSTGPVAPRPDAAYFPETGHNVRGRFLEYWLQNGGLAQFGFPLSEEGGAILWPTGQTFTVQYFERARFELHPENAPPYDVLLGQFGRRILADADLLATAPGFNLLYLTTERVQRILGRPAAPAARAPGAYQGFERGAMLWRGDTRTIYVLCRGDQQAGEDVLQLADTWQEGQDPGGGPGPKPGLYVPKRGFGKAWRENQLARDCLGYATTADETAYTITMQSFRPLTTPGDNNLLLSAATPEGRFIYAVYRGFLGSSSCISRPDLCRPDYERYPDPSP